MGVLPCRLWPLFDGTRNVETERDRGGKQGLRPLDRPPPRVPANTPSVPSFRPESPSAGGGYSAVLDGTTEREGR